jgi:hypothetical protein
MRKLGPACYAELPVRLPQGVLDGRGTQDQLCGDVAVAASVASKAGYLRLLHSESVLSLGGALAGAFAGGQRLNADLFGEGLGAHRSEHLMRSA